jgi:hypothetical protein
MNIMPRSLAMMSAAFALVMAIPIIGPYLLALLQP